MIFKISELLEDNNRYVDYYREHGFLLVRGVMNEERIKEYLENIYLVADEDFSAIMNPDRMEYLVAQDVTLRHMLQENMMDSLDRMGQLQFIGGLTWSIVSDASVVRILENLQGAPVSYLMSQMLFKQSGSRYATQAWDPHQDNAYPKNITTNAKNGLKTQYITTNFFLEQTNVANGTLYVYPKSHHLGLVDFKQRKSYREDLGSNPGNTVKIDLSGYEKLDLEFMPGDMIVMNGNLIHGSYPNNSERSRPLLSVSYITSGFDFIPGSVARRNEKRLVSSL